MARKETNTRTKMFPPNWPHLLKNSAIDSKSMGRCPCLSSFALELHASMILGRYEGARDASVPGPAFGPTAQSVQVFVHGLGEWHRLAHRLENIVHHQVALCVEGVIQSANDCFLDLGAAEVFAGCSQCLQVKVFGTASTPSQMDAENVDAFLFRRQIDEENLTQSS